MIDKEEFKKAQEWADQASEIAKYSPTMPERAKAAAEVIKSLPDEWVSADEVRKYIAAWRDGLGEFDVQGHEYNMLDDLEALLPAPPAPRTMDEIEWDDTEHHLAEATAAWTEGATSEVVMLHRLGNKIAAYQSAPNYTGLRELNPAILTPTGRKYRLEREEAALTETTERDDEPVFDPAYTYRDRHGDVWRYEEEGWWCYQQNYRTFRATGTPSAEFGPYTRIGKEDK